jgi:hypothetical protein
VALETGRGVTVCHFPPGTSKWPETVNKRIRDIRQILGQSGHVIQPAPDHLASLDDLYKYATVAPSHATKIEPASPRRTRGGCSQRQSAGPRDTGSGEVRDALSAGPPPLGHPGVFAEALRLRVPGRRQGDRTRAPRRCCMLGYATRERDKPHVAGPFSSVGRASPW